MESWVVVVVLLVAAAGVLGTPLVNDLAPGKEFPARNSVLQPSDRNAPEEPAPEVALVNSDGNAVPETPLKSDDSVVQELPPEFDDIVIPELPLASESSVVPESLLKSDGSVIPELPVKSEGSIVPESPVKSDDSVIPESPLKSDDSVIPESPLKSDDSLIPESPLKSDDSVIPESPLKSDDSVVPQSPLKSDDSVVPESPLKSDSSLVPDTPLQPDVANEALTPSRKSDIGVSVENVPSKLDSKDAAVESPKPSDSEIDQPKQPESTDSESDVILEEEPANIILKTGDLTKNEVKVDYSGAQVWKISTNRTGVRAVITRLRRRNLVSTWGGDHTSADILVKRDAIENVTRVFKRENIQYNVIIEDLQQRINEENPPLSPEEQELTDRSGHRMTWKQYHRLEDIHEFMEYLAKTYPTIVSTRSIGKSHEGRDLLLLRISDGKPTNKAVFIDGGIHAREWISPATVTYFINQFAENFDSESDNIKNTDWYFLPVVNPDGYEYTHTTDRLWRKNRKPSNLARVCSGTDLNRNFGYRWGGKGASSNPCSETFRGRAAFSEPESKALSDFIKSSGANFSAYLTYHSYGQYLLYPWGYDNVVPPDYQDLDSVGKTIAQAIQETGGSKYSVGSSSGLLYPASGGSDDWAKAQGIKYSYTIELSDTGRYGFILPTSYIDPVAKESLAGLRALMKIVHQG